MSEDEIKAQENEEAAATAEPGESAENGDPEAIPEELQTKPEEILAILEEKRVPAAFFVVGRAVCPWRRDAPPPDELFPIVWRR